jgi:hypothetical protein
MFIALDLAQASLGLFLGLGVAMLAYPVRSY